MSTLWTRTVRRSCARATLALVTTARSAVRAVAVVGGSGGLALLLGLGTAVTLPGCGGSARSPDGADEQPPPPDQSAREALEALETTPEQDDQLLALVGKFAIVLSKTGKARRAFTAELLSSLKRGGVDQATMTPVRAKLEEAIREATPEVLGLINELHAILTPEQRATLVDGLAARFAASEDKRKSGNKKMLDELDIGVMQKLDIVQAMADKMGALRDELQKMRADAAAAGEAFKQESFDATKLELVKTDLGKLYLETIVIVVDTLAPELEYEQRVKLAGIIEYRLNGEGRKR